MQSEVILALGRAGYDVAAGRDLCPGAPDDQVIREAQASGRAVLTNDKYFGEVASRSRRLGGGVILLRMKFHTGAEKAARLLEVLPALRPQLEGHFAVVTAERVRVRPLS